MLRWLRFFEDLFSLDDVWDSGFLAPEPPPEEREA
jgi:hypothetical protein